MAEFRILGPLDVAADDGTPLPLSAQKARGLLALLLLRANRVVSTDVLVSALWGEDPPRTATTSLHNLVVALRKLLGPDVLITRAPGYVLVVDPDRFDLARFERLVGEARSLEAEERAARLREALALWRGDALRDAGFDPAVDADVRRLDELRLTTTEDRIDADLACGRAAELIPELIALVAEHPLRERLRAQLMLAHYGAGRQDEALRTYHDARVALAELGLEPGPQLRELERRILRHEIAAPRATVAGDDAHFEQVAAALFAGALVPVLGADVDALGEALARRVGYSEPTHDLTRVAQFVEVTRGQGPLHDELSALLDRSSEPTAAHRFLASLPPVLRSRGLPHQLIVTTGYDLALERALLAAGEEFDVVAYVAAGRERGRFCHREPSGATHVIDLPNEYASELALEKRTIVLELHGSGDEGWVVTEDDYIGYLANGDVAGAIPVGLAAVLRRSHFLFLGYGMREWSLRLVFDRMCGGHRLKYRSWAIVPEARPLERDFWRARDVDLFEYSLDAYVDGLAQYAGLEGSEVPA